MSGRRRHADRCGRASFSPIRVGTDMVSASLLRELDLAKALTIADASARMAAIRSARLTRLTSGSADVDKIAPASVTPIVIPTVRAVARTPAANPWS